MRNLELMMHLKRVEPLLERLGTTLWAEDESWFYGGPVELFGGWVTVSAYNCEPEDWQEYCRERVIGVLRSEGDEHRTWLLWLLRGICKRYGAPDGVVDLVRVARADLVTRIYEFTVTVDGIYHQHTSVAKFDRDGKERSVDDAIDYVIDCHKHLAADNFIFTGESDHWAGPEFL